MPTFITNISLDGAVVPYPYIGILPPGGSAYIADEPTVVAALFGGAAAYGQAFRLKQVAVAPALATLPKVAATPTILSSVFEKSDSAADANILTYAVPAGVDLILEIAGAVDVSVLSNSTLLLKLSWTDTNGTFNNAHQLLSAVLGGNGFSFAFAAQAGSTVLLTTTSGATTVAYKTSAVLTKKV